MADQLQALLEAVGIRNKQIADNSSTVQDLLKQQQQFSDQYTEAIKNAGDRNGETPLTIETRELGQLQAQENSRRFASVIGTNLDDSTEILTALGEQYRSSIQEEIKARQAVQDKLSLSFMSNPAQWLINQFTIGDTINYADSVSTKTAAIEKDLANLNALTQTTTKTNNDLAILKTAMSIDDKVSAAKAQSDAEYAKAKINSIGLNIQGLKDLSQMSQEELHNNFQAFAAINQDAHLKIAQQTLQEQIKYRELAIEERAERIAQKKADRADLESFAAEVRAGAESIGVHIDGAMPASKIVQLAMNKQLNYDEYLKLGIKAKSAGDVTYISGSPGEAARTIVSLQAPLNPGQSTVKNLLTSTWQDATGMDKVVNPATNKAYMYDKTKVDQVTTATGMLAKTRADAMYSNIKDGDNTNIYAAPPLKALTAVPAVQQTEFYQKVLAPQMKVGGLEETKPDQIVSFASTAVKNGTLSFEEARKGVQTMFEAAATVNNRTKQYAGFGLPMQQKYNTQLDDPGLFFAGKARYDLTNATDVGNALSRRLRAQVYQANSEGQFE